MTWENSTTDCDFNHTIETSNTWYTDYDSTQPNFKYEKSISDSFDTDGWDEILDLDNIYKERHTDILSIEFKGNRYGYDFDTEKWYRLREERQNYWPKSDKRYKWIEISEKEAGLIKKLNQMKEIMMTITAVEKI